MGIKSARRTPWGKLLGAPAAAALAGIGYSALFVPRALPLPPAIEAERRETSSRAGTLSFYVAGQGAPLLLIHSVNAAASAYEVRPIFEHFAGSRRVYALDLPGFGFSERSNRDYTPRLYTDALLDLLDLIGAECDGAPVDALAVSLGGEFLARAASERPERFRSLALVSPTGFDEGERFYGEPGSVRGFPPLRQLYEFPLWGRALFNALNSRPSQRYFLSRTFGSYETIDQGLLEYDYLTAHQPGAQHAPFTFITGGLFSADIDRVYEQLRMPVWLAYGVRGDFGQVRDISNIDRRDNWTLQKFDTGMLPHFEQRDSFMSLYEAFLNGK
ncbi:MAG TPA: alpha/beta fold hydrolase [Roseiflexaceae bacterium]|nr:alpha/beta fold hydrolase [Roseiflexaceae bacterium]